MNREDEEEKGRTRKAVFMPLRGTLKR